MKRPNKTNQIKSFDVLLRSCFVIPLVFISVISYGQVDSTVLVQIDSLIEKEIEFRRNESYEDAFKKLKEAEVLVDKYLPKDFKLYATYWDKLGTEWKMGGMDLDKAEECFLRALEVRRKGHGEKDPEYAINCSNLGHWYYWYGNFEKAKEFFQEALQIRLEAFGENHVKYIESLLNLSSLYMVLGEYEKVEPSFNLILNYHENTTGKMNLEYAKGLTALGVFYTRIGNYQKAELSIFESIFICKSIKDTLNHSYISNLNNLAGFYLKNGEYEKAEKYFRKSLKITKKIYGDKHNIHADGLNRLGELFRVQGKYENAYPIYTKALNLYEANLGSDHPYYANTLSNLGYIYLKMDNFDEANICIKKSLEIMEKVYGVNHEEYASIVGNHLFLAKSSGRLENTPSISLELFRNLSFRMNQANSYLSSFEFEKFFNSKIQPRTALIQSLELKTLFKETINMQYDIALKLKGNQLEASKKTFEYILRNKDSTAINIYYKILSIHRRLVRECNKPINKRKSIKDLESQQETLEKKLARASATFRQQQAASKITHKEVKEALKPGEAAIEFVHFDYLNPELTDSVIYAAAILLPNAKHARFIPLFEEKQLYELLGKQETAQLGYAAALYGAPGKKENNKLAKNKRGARKKREVADIPGERLTPKSKAANLYTLIWQPLDSLLGDVKTIYYSPSGLLNRLNLGAIPIDEKTRMQDQYQLRWLSSTRQLALEEDREESGELDALVYGGIQYDYDSTVIAKQDTNGLAFSKSNYFDLTSRSLRGGSWSYLKGTAEESNRIHQLLSKNQYGATLKTGYQATEESFKQIGTQGKSPQVIHLATHGFFFPDPQKSPLFSQERGPGGESTYKLSDNPMIRSGLIMAGANSAWEGAEPIEGIEDGILTSYEISQLNLTNTELVVLSACETGLGDIKGSEGVFGLQRAFKKAGVKYLIMSLWQVPDQETKEFMVTFYGHWLEDEMSVPEAFQQTQQEMRKLYKDPYRWAGFVLME